MSSLPAEIFLPASGFCPDARFGPERLVEEAEKVDDPVETAFASGYEKGFDDATAKARARAEEEAAGRAKIETAFERLAESEGLRLEQRLRETILSLCENLLSPLAVDPDAFADRISRALALLRRTTDARVLRLHPDDLALVADRLSEGIKVEPDPSLGRGELRVETEEGGLEDGPEQWRRALSEALGL